MTASPNRKMKSRKTKPTRSRLSRSLLEKVIVDLAQRLDHQVTIAESIIKVAAPTGDTLVGSVPILTVIQLALGEHLRELQHIESFARIICERVQS